MKRNFGSFLALVASIFLQGCLGSGGSSAPPPTNVSVRAQDGRATITWNMEPGVTYWLFHAAGTGVTPANCSSMSLCSTAINVTSPYTVGLYNGIEYSFTLNGRRDGGPGGSGSTAVQATPRLAGATWTAGTSPSASIDFRGVAYGSYSATFVAAGTGGALYSGVASTKASGIAGITWGKLTNPLTTDLNAVNYDSYRGKYLSVGAGGKIIAMTPSSSAAWTEQTSNNTSDLFAIANNGAGTTVVTGDSNTIIFSTDGATWTPATSVPTPTAALYGVAHGYSTTLATNVFVAVGAAGKLLYSADYGVTWLAGNCVGTGCTADLKAVTYGGLDSTTGYGVFVAVGQNGTMLTSLDGITWTSDGKTWSLDGTTWTSPPPTATLNAVTYSYGRRFVAVADDGSIYYSEYGAGAAWTRAVAPDGTALNAVAAGGLYDFAAVGAGGVNKYAD
jgi:hypothetical protein